MVIVPGVAFDRMRVESTIQQVLQLLGFEPNRCHGDPWYGHCPLRDCPPRRRACFSVNVAPGRHYCHRCGRHGHQFELWAEAAGLLLYPAAIHLCAALGRDMPWIQRR
jgi:hypothetical protein